MNNQPVFQKYQDFVLCNKRILMEFLTKIMQPFKKKLVLFLL